MKKKRIILIVIIIMIALGFIITINATTSNGFENDDYSKQEIVIEVRGEVNRPGVYLVSANYTIGDCLNLAGGLTKKADESKLNLSNKVKDGQIIIIPSTTLTEETNNKISINKSTKEELKTINGIGETIANNIINYRIKNNGFKTLEELLNVDRISENLFNKIKNDITL